MADSISLEEFDGYIRSIGADVNHALLNHINVTVDMGYDFQTEDPFSETYRENVIAMYEKVAGRAYSIENEAWHTDIEAGVREPYPFATHDAATIGGALQSLGFLTQIAAPRAGERMVEFGVGWGNTTLAAAHTGAEVWAVDIEDSYLEIIRRRAELAGVHIETVLGDFSCVDQLPGKFDLALFYESFHHAADHRRFLETLIKCLKPEGRICWGGEPIYEEFWAPWGLRLDGLSVYCIRERGWLELGFRPSYFRQLMAQAGFDFQFHHLISVPGPQGWVYTSKRV